MKPFAFLMACLFLPMQTVYFVDCCCGDFCTHKNACPGCQDDQSKACHEHPNGRPGGDCCKDKPKPAQPGHEHQKKACAHVTPSSEITVASAVAPTPQLVSLDWVVSDLALSSHEETERPSFLSEVVPRPIRHVPLHLLLSVLQV